jgi:hypothetical protein
MKDMVWRTLVVKNKKVTKIVLFIAAFALISMIVGSILLGD